MDGSNGPPRLDIRHLVVAGPDDHPSAANGVHGVARCLVREQRAAGHDARLVALLAVGATPLPDPAETFIPAGGPTLGRRTLHPGREAVAAALSGAGAHTVFHIHGGREPLLPGFAAALRRRGLPYLITVHGRFSHVYDLAGRCRKRSTALYLGLAERRMLSRAHAVQALSDAEARVIRRVAPAAPVVVLGNGAYSSRLGPALPAPGARSRSPDFPHFVFCGRYAVHHKGLDLLLNGFALHARRGGAGRLTTVGSGPARGDLLALAATLGLAGRAEIGGPLFGPERDAVLAAADYFVMPSRFEGLPLAALDAAAAGLPLLVSAETGLAAPVRAFAAGLPIERLSAEAVAAALREAAAQPEEAWQRQRAAASRLVRTTADWTGISGQLCDLYRSSLLRCAFAQSVTS